MHAAKWKRAANHSPLSISHTHTTHSLTTSKRGRTAFNNNNNFVMPRVVLAYAVHLFIVVVRLAEVHAAHASPRSLSLSLRSSPFVSPHTFWLSVTLSVNEKTQKQRAIDTLLLSLSAAHSHARVRALSLSSPESETRTVIDKEEIKKHSHCLSPSGHPSPFALPSIVSFEIPTVRVLTQSHLCCRLVHAVTILPSLTARFARTFAYIQYGVLCECWLCFLCTFFYGITNRFVYNTEYYHY